MELREKEILVWLSHIEGISNKDIRSLIDYFGSIKEIFYANQNQIRNALNKRGIIVDKIIENRREEFIIKVFNNLKDKDIIALTILDRDYPSKLKNIYDPPYVIYIKGKKAKLEGPLIAIVGSRKATPYGKWAAYNFAKELTKWDIGIVSGLALGIDTSGHKGALDGNGYTVGVLGCGLDQCYPASNRNLMDMMSKDGCIISEYCLGMPPLKHHFPARNRIVSALSDGIIVVEASEKSGALITVEYALDQGKDVYALPGNINNLQSKGSNKLIRDGARILLEVDDVIDNLKYKYSLWKNSREKLVKEELSNVEQVVFQIIKRNPVNIDFIINETGMKASELSSILTILEIKGYITQMSGKTFTVSK